MKQHPELTIADILKGMSSAGQVTKPGGAPIPQAEQVEATIALHTAAADPATKVQVKCNACDTVVPILESTPCVCGGFICAHCRAIETEGECNHEPAYTEGADQ